VARRGVEGQSPRDRSQPLAVCRRPPAGIEPLCGCDSCARPSCWPFCGSCGETGGGSARPSAA